MDRRIEPDEAIAAYHAIEAEPYFGDWGDEDRCCPLAALYALDTGDLTIDVECATEWVAERYGLDYFQGFFTAIDEGPDGMHDSMTTVRGREGFEDGIAVRTAIIEAGLMEVEA